MTVIIFTVLKLVLIADFTEIQFEWERLGMLYVTDAPRGLAKDVLLGMTTSHFWQSTTWQMMTRFLAIELSHVEVSQKALLLKKRHTVTERFVISVHWYFS